MELSRENMSQEVNNFRESLNQEAVGTAEKSLQLKKVGNVGVIEFDCVGEKVNKLSSPNMLRLFDLLTEIEKDTSIGSLVIISRKPKIFIAGADIAEIEKLNRGEVPLEALMKLQAVFTYLENLPIPTMVAINGACLGGGLELSLACDYRIVTDAPETRLGLSEVQLGVIPGWGGTQRLPRLIGLEKSLDLILTGRHVDGKKAFKLGLADKIAPKEFLEEKAMAWAEELCKGRKKRDSSKQPELRERLLRTVPGGTRIIFDQARKKVLSKTKGHYPAPLKAIDVIKETFGGPLESGLKVEASAFNELVQTSVCKNLIQVFYLTEKVKKDRGVESDVVPRKVKRAGVLGAGVMGGGIAQLFAAKKFRVRMKDINWDAITLGYKSAYDIFYKRVKRRRMKQHDLDNAMSLIEGTTSYAGFKNLDLVVEAIVENLDIKKKVFKELDEIMDPKSVIATNTSSLSVAQLQEACSHPERVAGMHFFNPVSKMPLVEVVRGPKTSDEAVATVVQFGRSLGKTVVVVKDAPGFVVNRILNPYLSEAAQLLVDGVSVEDLDSTMEKFGMPMGPCTLLDEVGLDVAVKAAKIFYGAFGERMKPPTFFENITDGGRLGKKSGLGIYKYEEGKRKEVDATIFEKIETKKRDAELTDEVVQNRMVYLMVNEAARVLEEGLVRNVSDIDVAMIFGTGFAPFRGGLLRYADTIGPEKIVGELDLFSRAYGARFEPSQYLQKLAVDKKKFYEG